MSPARVSPGESLPGETPGTKKNAEDRARDIQITDTHSERG